jgi:hypothetical protein
MAPRESPSSTRGPFIRHSTVLLRANDFFQPGSCALGKSFRAQSSSGGHYGSLTYRVVDLPEEPVGRGFQLCGSSWVKFGRNIASKEHESSVPARRCLPSVRNGSAPALCSSLRTSRGIVLSRCRRRSQKSRMTWPRLVAIAERWLPQPSNLHPYPNLRFDVKHPR